MKTPLSAISLVCFLVMSFFQIGCGETADRELRDVERVPKTPVAKVLRELEVPFFCEAGQRKVNLVWEPHFEADLSKTYVAFDVNEDGSFTTAGRGKNGNFGHSAKSGASINRPKADTKITAYLPDDIQHTLHIYAWGSTGYFLDYNPVAIFRVGSGTCQ